ncbi:ATP-binding cassette domain-containing protein [Spiroplasma alleghenense]|uniref:ABC transporter ATP-binding protein n=1 Tax=Spiroplasma alleghenense TaxID=216931 RepID=A0A345Z321_9MOLU|nr:ATP-binding cassette domain-containing protein [Spiroplasma alleghenense]AXK51000.1 ABC transporter ATP-binding protein [Spiroplasma alleghenense]
MSQTVLSIKDLKKNYGKKVVLKNITIDIKEGERIAIVGPNGSGKTTFCEAIAGIIQYNSGNIEKAKNLVIGMQLQGTESPKKVKVWDLIRYYLDSFQLNMSDAELSEMFKKFAVNEVIDKDISALSGGQKQKVNILLSIINDPDLLILDELGNGLDIEIVDTIYNNLTNFLKDEKKTLILVSHNMEEIQNFSQRIFFINDGEIISIHNTKNVIKEYGNVREFVRAKFKEYKVDSYDVSDQKGIDENAEWVKDRKKRK